MKKIIALLSLVGFFACSAKNDNSSIAEEYKGATDRCSAMCISRGYHKADCSKFCIADSDLDQHQYPSTPNYQGSQISERLGNSSAPAASVNTETKENNTCESCLSNHCNKEAAACDRIPGCASAAICVVNLLGLPKERAEAGAKACGQAASRSAMSAAAPYLGCLSDHCTKDCFGAK